MDLTADQWARRLGARLDARRPRIQSLRRRMLGCGPLPESVSGLREAYQEFQRRARTNLAGLIVAAAAERMSLSALQRGTVAADDDGLRAIAKRSRLGVVQNEIHRDMLGVSIGYGLAVGDRGSALLVHQRPERCITEPDPFRPHQARAALVVGQDSGRDVQHLYLPGELHAWTRPTVENSTTGLTASWNSSSWRYEGWEPRPEWVPVVAFENADGLGEFESVIDILDRIDYGVLQRLILAAMQAFRQQATKGDLPDTDFDGNEIDYGALFKPGPGALWRLPPGVELWESGVTDITPLLSAVKDDIRDLAATTRTPLPTLVPDGANQSAEGANFAREGLIFKVRDRIERATPGWELLASMGAAIEVGEPELPTDVIARWAPPERLSLAERADAATKAANDLPWRTRITEIWGFTGEEADRMETERATDAMVAGMAAPPAGPVTTTV